MATFKDAANRSWEVRITVADLPRLRDAGLSVADTGADLTRVGKALLADPEAFGRAVWLLIERQAKDAGLTVNDFLAALDGPTAFAAVDAMEEAVTDFTRPPAVSKKVRELLPAARERANEAIAAAAERAISEAVNRIGTPSLTAPVGA